MNPNRFSSISPFSISTTISPPREGQGEALDLLIIGGGITGAGIALDAATRGLRVAVVEKHDWAWGTSSRSTKLIHGGLRYLKQMEFGLVREVGLERAIVHRLAPHLVVPERMLLPIVEGGSLGAFTTSLALWVYDFLAGVERPERRKMLDKTKTTAAEPLLRTQKLKGSGLYYEYRTDDARLTTEIVKTAAKNGAICLNYTEVVGFLYDNNQKIIGASLKNNIDGTIMDVKAKVVVNAAGPWVDALRKIDDAAPPKKRLHLTKGTHLVIDYTKLPLRQAVYFDTPNGDGRMIFAIPRGNSVYIGTTDTDYHDNIDTPKCSQADIDYLLEATNALFDTQKITQNDIKGTWAGLRPLIFEAGKSASELSRKDEIFVSNSGLISIAGGKLTGYRKMAERITDNVMRILEKDKSTEKRVVFCESKTKNLRLNGTNFHAKKINQNAPITQDDIQHFKVRRIGEGKQADIPADRIVDWVNRYGSDADIIIDKCYEWVQRFPDAAERCLLAELWYSCEYEMTVRIADFLIRRTAMLYFNEKEVRENHLFYCEMMGKLHNWDESRILREAALCKAELELYL
jgi:glycerol-3-phosphate dehydrogenase